MILGSDFQQLELSVIEVSPDVRGVHIGGDVRISVRARLKEFSGAADAWILRETWRDFLAQLTQLERERTGDAQLASISPGELRLRIFALDRAGHMAAEGELTASFLASHEPRLTSLKFGAIEFDPSALPSLLRELQSAAPARQGQPDP